MTGLQFLWFILIAVLFVGFFFLEGFDFGVGMSTRLLAKNRTERSQLIETIGPVWDGNEVWLLTAGGAMFASYPEWYASLFSGYYLVLFLILVGLIIRGVSFEFREKMASEKGRNFWDWTLFIGSTMAPFLFGLMFTSLVSGMPIHADKNVYGHFFDYVTPFSVVGAIAMTLICFLHGLNYIRLKTDGEMRVRAAKLAKILYPVLFVGLVVFAVLLYFSTDFFTYRPLSTLLILVAIVLFAVFSYFGALKDKEVLSFVMTGLILAGIVVLLFNGLFPRVMVSSISRANDILITQASSTPKTLHLMSYITFSVLPLVIAYQTWSYYVFRKRIASGREGAY